MRYSIVYTPYALRDITHIFDYLEEQTDALTARRYTLKIESVCQSLASLPLRGVPRDDIRPGLRTLAYRRRVVIAFSVEGECVVIHGIFQSGQDYEAILSAPLSAAED
jgi:plasmid stabilization system protein ParE